MRVPTLLAAGVAVVSLAGGGALAEGVTTQSNFLRVMSSIANVDHAIEEVRQEGSVLGVRLVALDELFVGENEQTLVSALASQRGTAQVYALRAVIADNRRLVAELQRLNTNFRNIVAIEIGETGWITIYTFGAFA
jgi:hypothetical protein